MAVHGIKWVKRLGGGVPEVIVFQEGASQTYKEGQPLVHDISLEGVKLASVGTTSLAGIAMKDATGTNLADAPVLVPTSADIFTATISASGANDATKHDQAEIGVTYDWIASTETGQTAKITVDADAAGGSDWCIITDVYTDGVETIGTAGGRVYFRFHGTALESNSVA